MRGTVSQHLKYLSSKGITGMLASTGALVRKFCCIQLSSRANISSKFSPAPPPIFWIYVRFALMGLVVHKVQFLDTGGEKFCQSTRRRPQPNPLNKFPQERYVKI